METYEFLTGVGEPRIFAYAAAFPNGQVVTQEVATGTVSLHQSFDQAVTVLRPTLMRTTPRFLQDGGASEVYVGRMLWDALSTHPADPALTPLPLTVDAWSLLSASQVEALRAVARDLLGQLAAMERDFDRDHIRSLP